MHSNHSRHLGSTDTRELLRPANSVLKAEIYLEEHNGKESIVKDFSHAPLLIRKTLGRFILNREIRTLRQLGAMVNVPNFIESVGSDAYRMQYVTGQSPTPEQLGNSTELLNQLSQLVKDMHQLGVTHNDIRPNNLILTPSNILFLIDFGAVFFRPGYRLFSGFPGSWLFNYLQHTDKSKVSRLKLKFRPDTLTKDDEHLINKTAFARKTTRLWKKYVLPLISPTKHRRKK